MDYELSAAECNSCQKQLLNSAKYCPNCGEKNLKFVAPTPEPDPFAYMKEEWYKAKVKADQKKYWKRVGILAIVLVIFFIVLGIGLQHHKDSLVRATSGASVAASGSTDWQPPGYSSDPKLNSEIAYTPVPASTSLQCTWCSVTHGNYFWKVDIVTKNKCPNFYMMANIYSSSHTFEKSWYQKGGTQSALVPFRMEIDSNDPNATYQITKLSCTGA